MAPRTALLLACLLGLAACGSAARTLADAAGAASSNPQLTRLCLSTACGGSGGASCHSMRLSAAPLSWDHWHTSLNPAAQLNQKTLYPDGSSVCVDLEPDWAAAGDHPAFRLTAIVGTFLDDAESATYNLAYPAADEKHKFFYRGDLLPLYVSWQPKV